MKKLLTAAAFVAIMLSACTSEQNPFEPAPEAIAANNGVALYAAVQQPDGSWIVDVDVPPNRCGVPAGMFTINFGVVPEAPGGIGGHANDGVHDVTKTVVVTWTKNSSFPMPEKIVETWTVKMLPDGPTVQWTVTRTRGPQGQWTVRISQIKCL